MEIGTAHRRRPGSRRIRRAIQSLRPCFDALALGAAVVACVNALERQASAATYSWANNGNSGNGGSTVWSSSGNWSGGTPVSSLDTTITSSTTQNTTESNDIGSGFQLNRLSVTTTGTKNIVVNGSSLNFVANSASVLPTMQVTKSSTSAFTISTPFTVTDALTITNSGTDTGSVVIQGAITNTAGITFAGTGASGITMQTGVISGTGGITKGGTFTVSLTAVETYQGGTTVNTGTLRVSGTGSINNTSGININGGEFAYTTSKTLTAGITFTSGILSGVGTVSAVSATNNNAVIAPGTSSAPGTYGLLTVNGNLSLKDAGSNGANDGGKLAIGVSKAALGGAVGAAGGTYDQVSVTSSASSVDLTKGVLVLSLGANVEAGDVYYILNNQISSGGLTGTFGSATINGASATEATTNIGGIDYQSFSVGIYNFAVSYSAVAGTSFAGSGNDVALQVVAAPEPASLGLVSVGGLGLLARRRRARGIISN